MIMQEMVEQFRVEMRDLENYKTMGQFYFRKTEYFATLTNLPAR
jgi:hypothetical protein